METSCAQPEPRLRWEPLPDVPQRICVAFEHYHGRCWVSWGDKETGPLEPGSSAQHTYLVSGRYMVLVRDMQTNRNILASAQVTVLPGDGQLKIGVLYEPVPTEPPCCTNTRDFYRYVLTVDPQTPAAYRYHIDWGTPGENAVEEVFIAPGRKHARWGLPIGHWTVTVTCQDTGHNFRFPIDVLDQDDPAIRLATEVGDDPHTIGVRITQLLHKKPVTFDWGDSSEPQQVINPELGLRVPHTYTEDAYYVVEAKYSDDSSTSPGMVGFDIPWRK